MICNENASMYLQHLPSKSTLKSNLLFLCPDSSRYLFYYNLTTVPGICYNLAAEE